MGCEMLFQPCASEQLSTLFDVPLELDDGAPPCPVVPEPLVPITTLPQPSRPRTRVEDAIATASRPWPIGKDRGAVLFAYDEQVASRHTFLQ